MTSHAEFFSDHGFVLIRGGIPPALVADLRRGFETIFAMRDRGETSGGSRRHQTILEPRCYHASFKDFLNLASINRAAEEVIATRELVFAGLGVLLGTRDKTELCGWHRDHPENDPATQALLKHPNAFLQLNCAVYDDPSLWVVPNSHGRFSTPEELAYVARMNAAAHAAEGHIRTGLEPLEVLAGMPGAINVKLQAGDCLLYNALIWHGAEYNPARKRATLHGGWRDAAAVDRHPALRWGIRHNPWLMHPDYIGELGPFFGPQLGRYQGMVRQYEPAFAAEQDAAHRAGREAVAAQPVALPY
ncbi:MAG: phytanoyl-CoA dioxygenase family protein [Planctomycetota bacterium]